MEDSTLTYNLGNLGFWMCSTGWIKQNCFRSHCSPIVPPPCTENVKRVFGIVPLLVLIFFQRREGGQSDCRSLQTWVGFQKSKNWMGFQKSKNNPATNLGKIHSFKSIVHYFLQVCPVKSTSFDAPTLKLKPTLNTSLCHTSVQLCNIYFPFLPMLSSPACVHA